MTYTTPFAIEGAEGSPSLTVAGTLGSDALQSGEHVAPLLAQPALYA
jgi:hypothetical protein